MTDFMLRTTTQAQMDDALEAAGILVEQDMGEGELALMPVPGAYLDRIGPIPATLDPEGEVIKDGDSRYHANIRILFELTPEQLAELPLVVPAPSVPYRVFG
jgi:hypothetical protein